MYMPPHALKAVDGMDMFPVDVQHSASPFAYFFTVQPSSVYVIARLLSAIKFNSLSIAPPTIFCRSKAEGFVFFDSFVGDACGFEREGGVKKRRH